MILAVCGKGGVGKTTVTAVAARELSRLKNTKALMVDADPGGGLEMVLSIQPKKTLNDVRKDLIEEVKEGKRDERDLSVSLDYLLAEALTEFGNLAFLSIGRPEDEGCYCKVNVLLKGAIEGLADRFDVTLLDAEAGIEQVNRKVMGEVDYVLLVSDTSSKGIRVAETIKQVADRMVKGDGAGLLINRVRDEGAVDSIKASTFLEIIGWIPEDDTIRRFDEEDTSFFDLPDCPAVVSIKKALEKVGLF
jgi:CO dehydrogenase maturation factor